MFKIEEFSHHLKDKLGYKTIFIYDSRIQEIVNKNPEVLCLENIEKASKNLEIKLHVNSLLYYDYDAIGLNFIANGCVQINTLQKFVYFFCHWKEQEQRVVVMAPLKNIKPLKNKILKFNNLKAFL